ncbi:hypothetical protein N431DRAFT_503858 [Stipitochalara longipes BDJ]|nr:hypothetical protein N431DRAFT_503858 [Stipitochalara longipes BDJ]
MQILIFIAATFIPSVLTQDSMSVTVSLVTITPGPSLIPTAVPQAYIGASTEPALGAYTTWYCPAGQIWSQVGNFARCCDNDPYVECGIATAYLSTSLMVGPSDQQTWTCSGTATQTLCVTGFVYLSIGATQAVTNVQCWPSWNGVVPITSSTMITMSTLTTSPISLTLSAHQTSTPSPSAFTLSPSRRMNAGTVTGIVVGALIFVIMAFITGFFLYKRSQHMNRSRKGKSATNDPDLPSYFKELKIELSAQTEKSELANGHDIQVQEVEEQRHINGIPQNEDSISVRTAGSTSARLVVQILHTDRTFRLNDIKFEKGWRGE